MRLQFVAPQLHELDAVEAEALACVVWEDVRPFDGVAALCDWRMGGHLSRQISAGFVTGRLDEVTLVAGRPRMAFEKIVLLGGGRRVDLDGAGFDRIVHRLLHVLQGLTCRSVVVQLPGRSCGTTAPEQATDRLLASIATAEARAMTWTLVESLDARRRIEQHLVEERRRLRPAP